MSTMHYNELVDNYSILIISVSTFVHPLPHGTA